MAYELTLDIGLNVGGREPDTQLSETLAQVAARFPHIRDVQITPGTWGGVPQRTVRVGIEPGTCDATRAVAALAKVLQQDTIAMVWNGMAYWSLVDSHGTATPSLRRYIRREWLPLTQ